MVRIVIGVVALGLLAVGLVRTGGRGADPIFLLSWGIIGALFVWFGARSKRLDGSVRRFDERVSEYLALGEKPVVLQPAYTRGTVLPIDRRVEGPMPSHYLERKVNRDVLKGLSGKLRPARDEEVETIVLLDWQAEVVGSYGRNRFGQDNAGSRYTWTATIVDRKLGAPIHREAWVQEPAKSVEVDAHGNALTGSWLPGIVSDYLNQLPRK